MNEMYEIMNKKMCCVCYIYIFVSCAHMTYIRDFQKVVHLFV